MATQPTLFPHPVTIGARERLAALQTQGPTIPEGTSESSASRIRADHSAKVKDLAARIAKAEAVAQRIDAHEKRLRLMRRDGLTDGQRAASFLKRQKPGSYVEQMAKARGIR